MLVCVMTQSVVESERSFVRFTQDLIVVKEGQVAQFNLKELHKSPLDICDTGGVIKDG